MATKAKLCLKYWYISAIFIVLNLVLFSANGNLVPWRHSHVTQMSSFPNSKVPDARPPVGKRLFNSSTVEHVIVKVGKLIKDDTLRQIFSNCLPSTLGKFNTNVFKSK